MFTGDKSGDILYRALYKTGFASQPESRSREDGLILTGAFITAAARCAPPGNKPTPEELRNCRPYFERELDLLPDLRVVVALGKIAFDAYLDVLKSRGIIPSRAAFVFGHDREFRTAPGQPVLISSYHPSQQNTSTGKLTETDAGGGISPGTETVGGGDCRRSNPGSTYRGEVNRTTAPSSSSAPAANTLPSGPTLPPESQAGPDGVPVR